MLDISNHYGAPPAEAMSRFDQPRFTNLWNRCLRVRPGENEHAADDVFAVIDAGYGNDSRSYHTRRHILHCLSRFDLVRALIAQADAVEMAIWFHDVVYTAGASDNELKSAQLFRELAKDTMAPGFVELVCELILDTIHQNRPSTQEGRYLVDIDLSSFGLPWSDFRSDSDAVREEFSHVSDDEFFAGQIRFLQSLIDRTHFYHTEYFRKYYEQLARSNVRRYLRELKQRGFG